MKIKQLVMALVLNVFALPGAGHWYLKRRRRALIFILPLGTGVSFLFYDLFQLLKRVTAQMASPQDPITQALTLTQDVLLNLEPYLMGLCLLFVLSMLDIIWIFISQLKEKKS
jgi:hypothetical protein